MGVNSHVLPGDIVITCDPRTELLDRHPDEHIGIQEEEDWFILDEGTEMLVLSVVPAGSSQKGHAFFVMTNQTLKFGWVHNYDVRPGITQRPLRGA